MSHDRRRLLGALAALSCPITGLLAGWPANAAAQAGAPRPVSWVIPYAAGGTTDTLARLLAPLMAERLGQPIQVENRAGNGGRTACIHVARREADGQTLLSGTIATHAINASLYRDPGYDPVRDFEPVCLFGELPNLLLVSPQTGVRDVRELTALLRQEPARAQFASPGAGSSQHLCAMLYGEQIGVKLQHTTYKGSVAALHDVAQGLVTFMFDQPIAALPLLRTGQLRALALTTPRPLPILAGVPDVAAAGLPGLEMSSWQGLFVRRGTPQPIVERLQQEAVRALGQPAVRSVLEASGVQIVAGSGADLAALIQREIPRWAALVRKSGAAET